MSGYSEHAFTAPDGVTTYYRSYPPDAPERRLPVLCMHGLTRNSKDFHEIAPVLANTGRRVIAVDVRGRGRSDRDPKPENYNPGVYVQDMIGLLAKEGLDAVACFGTSMGGLMTLVMNAQKPGLVRVAAINDIGPELDPRGLKRIQGYVGGASVFETWEAAAEAVRDINAPAFPNETSDAFWMAFARRVCVEQADGRVAFDYDPEIARLAKTADVAPPAMWDLWDAMAGVPTLAIRGALSDLLSADTLAEMKRRKPDLVAVEVPAVGHAPLLTEPEAETAIAEFFAGVE